MSCMRWEFSPQIKLSPTNACHTRRVAAKFFYCCQSAVGHASSIQYSPNSVAVLGVLTVTVKDGCLIEVLASAGGQLAAFYSTFIHLKIFECISTAQARRSWWWAGAGALQDCALVAVPCALSDLVITFRGWRKGNLVTWWATFRDRCRRSERFYLDVRILWKAQYFGHGGGLRRALIPWQVR